MATTAPTDLRLRGTPVMKGVNQDCKPVSNGHSQELSQEKIDEIDPFTYYPPFTAYQKLVVSIIMYIVWARPTF